MKRLAWGCWQAAAQFDMRRYAAALRAPEKSQQEVFKTLLRSTANTRFARQHGLKPEDGIADYQSRVPIMTPTDLDEWIQLIRQGEKQVLTNAPIERLVPTSGSTGSAKLIPMTADSRKEYALAVRLWMGHTLRSEPTIRKGRAYIATSPALTYTDPDSRVPVGYAADSAYLGVPERHVLNQLLVVPTSAARLRDAAWHQRVRHLLWNATDLRFLSLWHPSYLSALFDDQEISALPSRWPHLALISTWADGACADPARKLGVGFPHARHQRKGLWLTEGCISVPWEGDTPLAVLNGFLEFEDEKGVAHLAHTLQVNESYRPLLSNHAGLYRYRLGDVVRVTGFLQATPCIRWTGRADAVSDLCGEKLSEAQVEQGFEAANAPDAAWLRPDPDSVPPRYVVCVNPPIPDLVPLDNALRRNPHYDWARRLGQLGPLAQEAQPANQPPGNRRPHQKARRLIMTDHVPVDI